MYEYNSFDTVLTVSKLSEILGFSRFFPRFFVKNYQIKIGSKWSKIQNLIQFRSFQIGMLAHLATWYLMDGDTLRSLDALNINTFSLRTLLDRGAGYVHHKFSTGRQTFSIFFESFRHISGASPNIRWRLQWLKLIFYKILLNWTWKFFDIFRLYF